MSLSGRLIRDSYPALWAWIRKFEDLSGVGVEGEEEVLYEGGEVVDSLLQFTAQVYLPFLRANSSAIDNGEKEVKGSGHEIIDNLKGAFFCIFGAVELMGRQ